MADESRIINGFYKGISIAINSSSLDGGRRKAIKQFPSRDTQSVEDLGLIPRKYQLEIVISDKDGDEYFSYRNRLIAVLEEADSGVLIHPLYGRIDNVVAVTYSLNETFSRFGDTTISVSFEIDNNTGIPTTSGNVVTQLAQANEAVQAAVEDDIAENFEVSAGLVGNFEDAFTKSTSIATAFNDAVSFAGETSSKINQFAADLGAYSGKITSLVSTPQPFAQSILNLMQSADGLYVTASASFGVMKKFFGFGDSDTEIVPTTAGLVERKRNADVLNGAINAAATGYAYQNAINLDFVSVDDINEIASLLEDQYWKVQEGGSSDEVKSALTDLRVKTLKAFDDISPNTSQIIQIETLPTTVRLLAFDYYGSDALGQTIADQNGISDVSFVEGSVEILTQ